MDELLSRREAAQRAGVHANTLAAWERKGLIKARRVRVKGRE
jgi:DNA-binding transcriptional MerR regulator